MTNKQFASILALAVEKGKLNKSKLVEEFINAHDGSSKDQVKLDEAKTPTPEQVTFVADFRKKRAKIKDSQLDDYFNKIAENAEKPKATAPVAENKHYRAQER